MQFSLPINSNILKILGEWLFPVIAALTGEAILNNLSELNCVVFGSGGSAKAVVEALFIKNAQNISIINRTFLKAEEIASKYSSSGITSLNLNAIDSIRHEIKNADLIRSISDFTEKQVLKFGYEGAFVRFPAWINIENYLNAEIDRSFIDTFKIIFVGSVTERKNPKIIIESIETIDTKISIEIIGQTPNLKYLKELKENF